MSLADETVVFYLYRENTNRYYEELGCSFQTLEGKLPISYYTAFFNVITSTFQHYEQSRDPCIICYDDDTGLLNKLRLKNLMTSAVVKGPVRKGSFLNESVTTNLGYSLEEVLEMVMAFVYIFHRIFFVLRTYLQENGFDLNSRLLSPQMIANTSFIYSD